MEARTEAIKTYSLRLKNIDFVKPGLTWDKAGKTDEFTEFLSQKMLWL